MARTMDDTSLRAELRLTVRRQVETPLDVMLASAGEFVVNDEMSSIEDQPAPVGDRLSQALVAIMAGREDRPMFGLVPIVHSRIRFPRPEEWAAGLGLILTIDGNRVVRARTAKVGAGFRVEMVSERSGIDEEHLVADREDEGERVCVTVGGDAEVPEVSRIGEAEDLLTTARGRHHEEARVAECTRARPQLDVSRGLTLPLDSREKKGSRPADTGWLFEPARRPSQPSRRHCRKPSQGATRRTQVEGDAIVAVAEVGCGAF